VDMDCKDLADLSARVLSGNALPEDEARLAGHLASCAGCTDRHGRLARVWAMMGQIQPLASRASVPAVPRKRSLFKIAGALTAAAGFLLACALALRVKSPPAPTSGPAVAVETPARALPVEPSPARAPEAPAPAPQVVPTPAPVKNPEPAVPKTAAIPQNPQSEPQSAVAAGRKEETPKAAPVLTRPAPEPVPAPAPAAAAPAPLPVIALVTHLEGDVTAVSAGKRVSPLPGHKLGSGDALETVGKTGHAVVEFTDGTRLTLGPDTILDSIRQDDGKRVSVKQGTVAARVAKQAAGEPMIFFTANSEARVLGTRLSLLVVPTSTRLEVREGRVRITRKEDGASAEVGSDHFLIVGKGLSMAPKPLGAARIALHEAFDRARWGSTWQLGGEPNLGVRMVNENGTLAMKVFQKPIQDVAAKMPPDASELPRKAVQGTTGVSSVSRKEWPRSAWLETRQPFPFSNESPLRIRTRVWNSHGDADRIVWLSLNRGVSGQGVSLERRGASLQLWIEGAQAPVWKTDLAAVQEWETLELWLSKDQLLVRRNDETLHTEPNPFKVRAASLALGTNAKLELPQDEEARFDGVDVFLTTRAEFDEVGK
jgi:ferric-dicitrate binding protein FerR (iron transport regulator)